MFKNKYLKQLQEVQAQIRSCTSNIAKVKMPTVNHHTAKGIMEHLQLAMEGAIGSDVFLKRNYYALSYLEELGNYFISIAKYERERQVYEEELNQLCKEERRLKEMLGID